jgi:hypothetical protein
MDINTAQIKSLYGDLRKKNTLADIKNYKGNLPSHMEKMDSKKINESLAVIVRIAKDASEADFVKWFESDFTEVPPIKLSEQELELVKGGFLKNFLIGLGTGVAVTLIAFLF